MSAGKIATSVSDVTDRVTQPVLRAGYRVATGQKWPGRKRFVRNTPLYKFVHYISVRKAEILRHPTLTEKQKRTYIKRVYRQAYLKLNKGDFGLWKILVPGMMG